MSFAHGRSLRQVQSQPAAPSVFPEEQNEPSRLLLPRGNDPTASKAVTSKRGDDAFFFGPRCSLLLDFGLTKRLHCRYALFADTCTKASFPIHSPNARPGGFLIVLGLQQTCSNQSGPSKNGVVSRCCCCCCCRRPFSPHALLRGKY
jgi:hypothetical protein